MTSPLERLCGPNGSLHPEPANAAELKGLLQEHEVRVGDDERWLQARAEFERDALESRAGPDAKANFGAAGECDHADRRMFDEEVADGGAGPGHDIQCAIGQSAVGEQVRQFQSGHGRGGGRLMDYAIAGGERRADLVDAEIERKVEWRDGGNDTQRFADGEGHAALARRGRVHWYDFAGQPVRLLR